MTDEPIHLLDELQSLLEKQIELTRRSNVSETEALSEQAGSLVERIVKTGILELPGFKSRRAKLQKLCNRLCLAIAAQKADTAESLSRVRKGRKLLGAYAGSFGHDR